MGDESVDLPAKRSHALQAYGVIPAVSTSYRVFSYIFPVGSRPGRLGSGNGYVLRAVKIRQLYKNEEALEGEDGQTVNAGHFLFVVPSTSVR